MSGKKKRVHLTAEQIKEREFYKSRQAKAASNVVPASVPTKTTSVSLPLGTAKKPVEVSTAVKSLNKAKTPKADPLLLNVADLCALLKISRRTLIRMEQAGKIPGRVMLGSSVRYHRETIEGWLRELVKDLQG